MKTTHAQRRPDPAVHPAVTAERQRVAGLQRLGNEHHVARETVDAMVLAGTSIESARRAIVVVGEDRSAFQPFATFGEQLRAVRAAASGEVDPRLRLVAGTPSGMNESVGSEGAFLVQSDFAEQILERAWNYGQILKRVKRYGVPADRNGVTLRAFNETSRADGQRLGGVQAFWLAEADTATSKKPSIRMLKFELKKLVALCYLTSELDADSPSGSAATLDAFAKEISFLTEDAIVNGGGEGQPLGIRKSTALFTQTIEATQTIANSPAFIGLNVTKMFARLFASRDPSAAAWLVNAELLPTLHQIVIPSTGGTPVTEAFDFDGPGSIGYGTLLGRPVIPAEYCQPVGTPGDIILTDLAEYLLVDKEPGQLRSIHVKFLTDEVAYRVVYRVDGQPLWSAAVSPKNGSNTVSPYVALGTRA
jgi:HK97 family phage major capsid protein